MRRAAAGLTREYGGRTCRQRQMAEAFSLPGFRCRGSSKTGTFSNGKSVQRRVLKSHPAKDNLA